MLHSTIGKSSSIRAIRIAGRRVGEVRDGVFKKRILFSRHSLRKPPALAISARSLDEARKAGAREIQITDLESGRVYASSLAHFLKYAWTIQRGGFEPQLAMTLDRWQVTCPPATFDSADNVYRSTLAGTHPEVVKTSAVQLSFLQ